MPLSSIKSGRKHVQAKHGCQPPISHWVDSVLDTLLPAECLHCGDQTRISHGLCTVCRQHIQPLLTQCRRCALELPQAVQSVPVCGDCLSYRHAIDHAWAAFSYTGPVKALIRQLKFHHGIAAGQALSAAFCEQVCPINLSTVDLLIPAPLHHSRLRERGFNQALELSRDWATRHHLDIRNDLLLRTHATQVQAKLNARQRLANVSQAFSCREPLHGESVAIFDDVMTTGATMKAMAKSLKQAGAGRVIALALARA